MEPVPEDWTRALAIEFGTQWIHVRGFDELKEKNEALFPSFDAQLRTAIYEESVLFFQDLFQSDRTVTQVLDADYTFANQYLAEFYGLPGVKGAEFRRVSLAGTPRRGVLGQSSVLASSSYPDRTSVVLRGKWILENLLNAPPPPAPAPPAPDTGDLIEQLTQLGKLKDAGVLTEAEFDQQKAKLLGT